MVKTRDIAELALYEAHRTRNPIVVEPRIEIHQKPNDAADAARLYGEMQDKARAEIVQSIRVGDSVFECVVQQWRDEMADATHWRAVFSLNGKKMEARFTEDWRDRTRPFHERQHAAFTKLRDEVAKVLAGEVLAKAFAQAARQLSR